ncbi:hypothetical protein BT67DRAFT_446102 [Trichocladium antarcticum]|uniref:Uncharacterized protein n=1 Tax=Trichocladium antarcticum TaxID=1450529 RepID=A0AAN6UBJ2_9PEZI|nr:hypothetical protein BT67DRAFT_446102 [Trichocladium antarcticum]
MAPNTRTRHRQRDVDPTPPLDMAADGSNPGAGRESRNRNRDRNRKPDLAETTPQKYNADMYGPNKQKLWTPEPEPYDPDTYTAWGRKHFGEDWYQHRKSMLEERNIYIQHDLAYNKRQRLLRAMEDEREEGKLPQKGKTWQQLMAWARAHYGEAWYRHWEALARLSREIDETSDPDRETKLLSKQNKHAGIMRDIQLDTDERMLADGKSWHDILASPAEPSNIAPAFRSPSPSSDGETDLSGYDTYPPTPTHFRSQAMHGPRVPLSSGDVNVWRPHESEWDCLEWRGVHGVPFDGRTPQEQYEQDRSFLRSKIRSWNEDDEVNKRREAVLDEIQKIRYLPGSLIQSPEYDRRKRNFSRRADGWTEEQIAAADAAEDRAATAYLQKDEERMEQVWTEPSVPMPGFGLLTREEMIAKHRAWDASGLSKEEQAEYVRMFGLPKIKASDISATAPKHHRTQRKTYQKERASRRLAGRPPEFGMLLGRGETQPLPEAAPRQSRLTRTTSSPGARNRRSQNTRVKGAKPPGISKSKQAGTRRSKLLARGSRS